MNRRLAWWMHIIHIGLTLLFSMVLAPSARAEGHPPPKIPAPDLLRHALAQALSNRQSLALTDDDYTAGLPAATHPRSYPSYHSQTAYPRVQQPINQKLIDEASGLYKKAPIGVTNANTASGSGTVKGATALPGAPKVDPNVLAAVLWQADQAQTYALNVLNNVNNGNWNQFLGQPSYPDTWYSNYQDPLYAGVEAPSSVTTRAVLGFGITPQRSFAAPFLTRLGNVLYAPWTTANLEPQNQLEARYQGIEQRQLARYYTDPNLSGMRIELNRGLLFYAHTDPYYMYWSYEYNTTLETIRTGRPSYPALQSLAQEIASWSTPPTDTTTLRTRYAQRLALPYLQAQVELETAAFLLANPTLASQLKLVQDFLALRLSLSWQQPAAMVWYAGWQKHWLEYYFSSAAAVQEHQDFQQLLNAYPAFQEYTQLNNEVIDLLPSFNDFVAVQNVATLSTQVQTSPDVARGIATAYNQYKVQIETILTGSTIAAELETYYERLNGLVENDTTYQQLKTIEALAVVRIREQQLRIHDAVLQCYRSKGFTCDPYSDPAIFAQLYGNDNFALISGLGAFYEVYNRFWYAVYATPEYKALETDTSAKVKSALNAVSPQLQSAKQTFKSDVNAIPLVSQLNQARNDLISTIRSNTAQISSLPISDPSPELRKRLDRMAQLASQLNRPDLASQSIGRPQRYLPLMWR
jgi:hypothetical protein